MSEQRIDATELGDQCGTQGMGNLITNMEAYCACEKQKIAVSNKPTLVAVQGEAAMLLDEEQDLTQRRKQRPAAGDLRTRQRKAMYFAVTAAVLIIASYVFSLYGVEPFRLGLKAYLYCLAVAIVSPFLVEYILEPWKGRVPVKTLAAVGCAAGFLSLILLAAIRGDRMAEETRTEAAVVVIDGQQVQPAQSETTFYEKTIPLLQLMMILLAIAMEIGAGCALHEVWRFSAEDKEDWQALDQRLIEVRRRLAELGATAVALQLEPQLFGAQFWSSFYRAVLTRALRSSMTKLFVMVVLLVLATHPLFSQAASNWVIAPDLTQSESVRGPDGKSEFQKNIEAVTDLLARVPANSHITVIGITDHSFTQPYILLSATVPADTGYFGERLAFARSELVRAWKFRSSKLTASFPETDILGAIALAEQIFSHYASANRELLIYSDMRNSTPELNLETGILAPRSFTGMRQTAVPDLHNVTVTILGAASTPATITSWQKLREFWIDYFRTTGASLAVYSPMRSQLTPGKYVRSF